MNMTNSPLPPEFQGGVSVKDHIVPDSEEFQRILRLPRRIWEVEIVKNDLHKRVSQAFRLPTGQQELRPIQAAALADGHDIRGLLGPLRVGDGKTLVSFLFPVVVQNIRNPVLLVPAALIEKTWNEFQELKKHWLCHPAWATRAQFNQAVISYEKLGRDSGKDALMNLERVPDMIIADECFVKNTLIQTPRGLVPIQDIKSGDTVTGGDGTETIVRGAWSTVAACNSIFELVVGAETLYCTGNHPFLTDKGWVRADELVEGSAVVQVVQEEPRQTREKQILHAELLAIGNQPQPRGDGSEGSKKEGSSSVCVVQEKTHAAHAEPFLFETLLRLLADDADAHKRSSVQQEGFQEDQQGAFAVQRGEPRARRETPPREDVEKEPYTSRICSEEDFRELSSSGAEKTSSTEAWWERPRDAESPAHSFGSVGTDVGHRDLDRHGQRPRTPLQARHLSPESEDRGGGRWPDTLSEIATEDRSGERYFSSVARLVRVSSIKRCSSEPDSFDGKVYNLEVEGTHTYLVGSGIVAHNCHRLRNRTSAACTKRVDRFMTFHPECLFVGMSGTITKRSIRDYWHLLKWALKKAMPLPMTEAEMEIWAEALDERSVDVLSRRDPGVLLELCTKEERDKVTPKRTAPLGRTDQMPTFFGNLEEKLVVARTGYQRRLRETPGVVCSPDKNIDCSLQIRRQAFDPGPDVMKHIEHLREEWETPNGDSVALPVDVWRHARELATGFYYRWEPRPPMDWMQARKRWNWYVRETLIPPELIRRRGISPFGQTNGALYTQYKHLHLDSPFQVANAIRQGIIQDPNIRFAYSEWDRVKDSYKINVVADWISPNTLDFCCNWSQKNGKAILWTEHRAFGEALAKRLGTGFCSNGGLDAQGRSIESYKGETVVASVAANKEGRNLQLWHRNLIITAPPNGALWEQLLGRTHRMGQQEDTVYVDWLCACAEQDEGFSQLMADARYIQQTTGQSQKLLYADHI